MQIYATSADRQAKEESCHCFFRPSRKSLQALLFLLEVVTSDETRVCVYDPETEELVISVPEEHQANLFCCEGILIYFSTFMETCI
jgi:hypothetical protein